MVRVPSPFLLSVTFLRPSGSMCLEDKLSLDLDQDLSSKTLLIDLGSHPLSPEPFRNGLTSRVTVLIAWPAREMNHQNMPSVF